MLLVPEWVFAWAVRQRLQAGHYAGMPERARVEAADELEATLQDNRNSTHEGHMARSSSSDQEIGEQAAAIRLEEQLTPHNNFSNDIVGSIGEVTTGEGDNEQTMLIPLQSRESTLVSPELASKLVNWQLESDLGRTNQSWTMAHSFLIGMGGFHSYRGGEPMFPLDYDDVLALVRSRSLVPPTLDELRDKSKGDAFSMAIASSQTLWFIVQFATRRVEGLVIAILEATTLAYCVITAAMYLVSFQKPINVRCPIRVKGENERIGSSESFRWSHIVDYVIGNQDRLIRLSSEERVPTFWSNCSTNDDSKLPLYAYIIGLGVAIAFGGCHWIIWNFTLPSRLEWRVCTMVVTAIPLAMAVAFAVSNPFATQRTGLSASVQRICIVVGTLLYILARILFLLLSLAALRNMPLSAYRLVQWTQWLPHI
ncbi:hypothetical protein FIBSPDRAFT_802969 [Athelia psychrophila]|uniref:Uncharacterized protein n=1 Tax=Athelia psychrophila TaxID=1759441 RepID=A0A165XCS3_9AGAM|nr:hypothetical protein FIBSPDRAFT_802969 [Fibularhizoctonia sp. CBS 109695]